MTTLKPLRAAPSSEWPRVFDRVVAHFGNGTTVPLQIRSKIPAGGQTRVIDLPGKERIIVSLEVWYARGNPGNPQKPHLVLYGMH